jgi:hypothetical protein
VEEHRGFWETIKKIKRQGPKPKFCPKCKGSKIYPSSSLVGLVPPTYKCEECDYQGHLVFEIELKESTETEDPLNK